MRSFFSISFHLLNHEKCFLWIKEKCIHLKACVYFKNWNINYKWSFTIYYLTWELNCVKLINNFSFFRSWIITIINIISCRLKFYRNSVLCVSEKREKWITAKWKMEVKTLFEIIQIRFFWLLNIYMEK